MNGEELFVKYRWKATGLAVVLISGGIFLYLIVPDLQEVFSRYSYGNELQKQIDSASDWENKLADYGRQTEQLNRFYSKMFVGIPQNDQMSVIVGMVYDTGRQAGVKILRMHPSERIQNQNYTVVPVKVMFEGSFHEIGRFVNLLEEKNYLVKLTKLRIRAPGNLNSDQLMADLEMRVMVVKSENIEGVSHG